MQDAQEAFIATAYTDKLGVQGFYDTLIDHAQNMSIYPDNWVMIDTFLRGIPDVMRDSLICDDGLSPEVNTVEEFVAHALRYEQSHKIAKHFELHHSKTRIETRAEPQKVGTFWARKKELAGNTNPWVVEDKPRAYVRAVQMAVPNDDVVDPGNEPDGEDDEVDNLTGNVPEDNTASEVGEHPGNEFIEVDVYDNDYYAWESDTEFMGALTDYLASELDWPSGAGDVKVYKVHLRKVPGKLARPVVRREDKECLASYIEVNGHKVWTLWDSGSTTMGVTPQFCQVHDIYVSELKEPLLLQLGTVGSRAAVQFGMQATVACAGVTTQEYMDMANFNRYDMIIGTPYMRKHHVILDFEKNEIVVGGKACPTV
ncbi:hypothetical protein C0992_008045 [Termitomyces sp. T32_za158]|nr:hypothetical protein C0992_008045 [Termitomyces sp. T32_za158]